MQCLFACHALMLVVVYRVAEYLMWSVPLGSRPSAWPKGAVREAPWGPPNVRFSVPCLSPFAPQTSGATLSQHASTSPKSSKLSKMSKMSKTTPPHREPVGPQRREWDLGGLMERDTGLGGKGIGWDNVMGSGQGYSTPTQPLNCYACTESATGTEQRGIVTLVPDCTATAA